MLIGASHVRLLFMWIFNVVALYACEQLIDGIEFSGNFGTLVLTGLVFALVNLLLKPVTKLLALPLILITFGIALFFINILMLYITGWIVSGFKIDALRSGRLGDDRDLGRELDPADHLRRRRPDEEALALSSRRSRAGSRRGTRSGCRRGACPAAAP